MEETGATFFANLLSAFLPETKADRYAGVISGLFIQVAREMQ